MADSPVARLKEEVRRARFRHDGAAKIMVDDLELLIGWAEEVGQWAIDAAEAEEGGVPARLLPFVKLRREKVSGWAMAWRALIGNRP